VAGGDKFPFGPAYQPFWQVEFYDAYVPSSNILSIVTCLGRSPLSASSLSPFSPCTPTFDNQSPAVGECCHSSTWRVGVDTVSQAVSHPHVHTVIKVPADNTGSAPALSRELRRFSSASKVTVSSERVAPGSNSRRFTHTFACAVHCHLLEASPPSAGSLSPSRPCTPSCVYQVHNVGRRCHSSAWRSGVGGFPHRT
jgi:hypothetical protein